MSLEQLGDLLVASEFSPAVRNDLSRLEDHYHRRFCTAIVL
jgi:hypothetical protein